MFAAAVLRGPLPQARRSLATSISAFAAHVPSEVRTSASQGYATMQQQYFSYQPIINVKPQNNTYKQSIRTKFTPSSFSALPPEEEEKEKTRVAALSDYQKEMELRNLDADIARLQTLRGINTGELYTLRGKFKMLSRDYGMGFLAWYWTVWFATAGLTYAAIEVGGVDPIMVMSKAEMWLGWEHGAISGKVDPTLGQLGLVIVLNECLEPLRLPVVVMTTRPVVNAFQSK